MGQFAKKLLHGYHHKKLLKCIAFEVRTVNAIDFLFSKVNSTPFLYVKLCFGVLQRLSADVTRPDNPLGSKLPDHLVGAFKSLHILCVRKWVLSLLIWPVHYFSLYPLRRCSCANVMHIKCSIRAIINTFHSPNPQSISITSLFAHSPPILRLKLLVN